MSKVLSLLVGLLTDHVTVVGWGKDARQLGIVSCAILGEIIETSWVRLLLVGALNAESQCSWAAVPDLQGTDHVISVVVAAKMHVSVSLACALLLGRILLRVVTFAWRMALSMLRASVPRRSCRTASTRGDSTGAVLGLWRHARCC